MKVLLINPPMQVNRKPEIPSLGISFVTQALRKNGHEVAVLDIDGYRYSKEAVSEILKRCDARVIGIGGLVTVYPYLNWLVPEIRSVKPEAKIILGGAVASCLKEKAFRDFDIDFAVIGEGEITTPELLQAIESSKNFSSILGIGYRQNGTVVFTPPRPLMKNLSEIPFFDDTLFPFDTYLRNTGGICQIHTQRGCPGVCTFCFNSFRVVSRDVRYRPYEKVVDEICYFQKKYKEKIRLFAISGECITTDKEWLIGFCSEILKRRMKIRFRVTSRVDTIDEERLQWLKRSGCCMISFGLESGSKKILKIIKKGASLEQGMKAVAMAKRYIPEIEACMILGYLGETPETLRETVEFCKNINVRPSVFFATPFPGTELYSAAIEKGLIKDEQAYLMGLDTTLTCIPSLNLTEMPDEEARIAVDSALKEINRYYLKRDPSMIPFLFKKVHVSLKENGVKNTCMKIMHKVRYY